MEERKNVATINGTPLTLLGTPVQVGQQAPEVTLEEWALVPFKLLGDSSGKIRVISVIPSIDTGLCEMQTLRMSREMEALEQQIAGLDGKLVLFTVSSDIPAAQARWCGKNGVDNVVMLSDHMEMEFGKAYGTWLKELRANERSIFIVDANNVIRHAEYKHEVGHAIDYDKAIAVVKKLLPKLEDNA
jgi:thiol peroxidase